MQSRCHCECAPAFRVHLNFKARLREECLNRVGLWTLTEAWGVIEDWRWNYNLVRPHRLGLRPSCVPALTYSMRSSK
ncbi:MAG: hypothetical protein CMQ21_17345 [Gammaproteobacteria bacterium]|nr:hypothetical protein [Gammaproteobacteria bacterium]